MTDTSIAEGGETDGSAGAPNGTGTTLDGGDGAGGFDFKSAVAGLPEEIRENPALSVFDSFEGMAKSLLSAQAMVGADKVVIPGEGTDPELVADFYKKMGVPETTDGYSFEVPEGLPEGFEYSEDTAKMMQDWALEAKLTPDQAKSVHDKFVNHMVAAVEQVRAEENDAVIAADKAVREAWGGDYDRKVQLANRALMVLGGEKLIESLKKGGMLTAENEVRDPAIMFAFAEAGSMMGEDLLPGGEGPTALPGAAAAKAEIAKLKADPEFSKAWMNESHQGHAEAVAKMTRLQKLAAGEISA